MAALTLLVSAPGALAQTGQLDLTFNPGPFTRGGSIDNFMFLYALAVQPDGKIVVGGDFDQVNFVTRPLIARFNPDGSLDPSFNTPIEMPSPFGGEIYDIVIQPDGRILVGGSFTVNGQVKYLVRLNADGSLDPSFNANVDGLIYRIVLQPDGRMIIGSNSLGTVDGMPVNHLARLNPDGSLHTPLGAVSFANGSVFAIVLQPDGKILVGGSFYVVRLNADGTYDATFSPPDVGIRTIYAMALQPDGRVVYGGSDPAVNGGDPFLARLNPDGTPDAAFSPAIEFGSVVWSIVVQPDGGILIGGEFNRVNGVQRGCIARLNPDGTLDAFHPEPFGADWNVEDIAIEADGNVLIAGSFQNFFQEDGSTIRRTGFARLLNGASGSQATTTTIASSLNPATFGGQVTFTVTVSGNSPTGTVTLLDGGVVLTPAIPLSGGSASHSMSSLTAGTHTITAQYSGDTSHAGSTSAPLAQVVDKAMPAMTLMSSRNPSGSGEPVTLSGTVPVNASGTVTISDGATPLGTVPITNGGYTLTVTTLSLGTHQLRARYSGDANYLSAESDPLEQVVEVTNAPPQVTPVPDQTVTWGSLLQVPVFATDADADPLTFSLIAAPPGSAITAGGQFTWTPSSDQVGVHTITVQVSDGTLTTATSFTVTVRRRGTTVSYLGSGAAAAGPVALSARLTDVQNAPVPGRTIAFQLGTQGASGTTDAAGLATATIVLDQPVGAVNVSASFNGDAAYDPSSSSLNFRIDAAPLISPIAPQTITWGQTLSFFVDASDPEGGPLTFSLLNAPAGVGLVFESPTRRSVVWTPVEAQVGLATITIGVSDGVTTVSVTVPVEVLRPVGPPPVVDTDGDGIPDEWELNGVDIDDNGTIDLNLPAMGAHPLRKDIFVEVDWMVKPVTCVWQVCWSNGGVLQPQRAVLDALVATFAMAPVSNPDGSTGITLHVDGGPATVMNPATGELWGASSRAGIVPYFDALGSVDPFGMYDWAQFDSLKQAFFDPARRAVFHYAIYANTIGSLSAAGISRGIPAADFIVAAGHSSWNGGMTATQERGVFMHELGHNLALHHGGADDINYKPNYHSVQNYLWSLTGLPPDNRVDYSSLLEPPIDETLTGDVNNDGRIDTLLGYQDWPNLVFTGGGIGALQAVPQPATTPIDPIDPEELRARGAYARAGDALLFFKGPSLLVSNSGMQALTIDVKNISLTDAEYGISAEGALLLVPVSTSSMVPAGQTGRITLPVNTNGLVPGDYIVTFTLRSGGGELVHRQSARVVVVDLTVPENQQAALDAAEALAALPPDSGLDPSVRDQIVRMIDAAVASWTAAVQITGALPLDAVYRIAEPQIDPAPGRITVRSLPNAPRFELHLVRAGQVAAGTVRVQRPSGELFEAVIAGRWNESLRSFEGKWFDGKRAGGSLVFSLREP